MTTITLEAPSTTGRLEELVDRLLSAMFPPDSGALGSTGAQPGQDGTRCPAAQAGGRPGRCAGSVQLELTPLAPRTASCDGSTASGWTSFGAGSPGTMHGALQSRHWPGGGPAAS